MKALIAECFAEHTARISLSLDLIHFQQIRVFRFGELLHQLIVLLEPSLSCNQMCSMVPSSPDYRWYSYDQLNSERPELFANDLISRFMPYNNARCSEFSIKFMAKLYQSKWELLQTLEVCESAIGKMYDDFQQQCYPSMTMNRTLFVDYIRRHGFTIVVNGDQCDVNRLYHTFCVTKNFLSFRDFVLAIIALDQRCPHRTIGGEMRARLIFRYYATPGSSAITNEQLAAMYADIQRLDKRTGVGENMIGASIQKLHQKLKLSMEQPIPMEAFLELVGSLEIRGTSSLLRSNFSILDYLSKHKLYNYLYINLANWTGNEIREIVRPTPTLCKSCASKSYRIAIHSLMMNAKCVVSTVQEMSVNSITFVPKHLRAISYERINPKSIFNEIRAILRRFARLKYGFGHIEVNDTCPKWEKNEDRLKLAEKIFLVCKSSAEYFRSKPRVMRIQSPIYIFGDIHGNFKDLMIYDRLFWRTAPSGHIVNCLFLGDYVDRGDSSLECVLYLLCLMLQRPDSINLLRGNHEFRPIQRQFTFHKECCDKFDTEGDVLWEAFNNVFDCMPLCAVIDEQIYCAHGGIPTTVTRLELLDDMPVPMPNPSAESKLAWEALWNDPISNNEYNEFLTLLPNDKCTDCPRGFLPNIKRGTAFYYSEEAVDNFLEQNNLSFIVRGHEVVQPGFHYHMDGKVVTIFSCSNYCGADNEAAVVYLEASKVRIIKIDTNIIK